MKKTFKEIINIWKYENNISISELGAYCYKNFSRSTLKDTLDELLQLAKVNGLKADDVSANALLNSTLRLLKKKNPEWENTIKEQFELSILDVWPVIKTEQEIRQEAEIIRQTKIEQIIADTQKAWQEIENRPNRLIPSGEEYEASKRWAKSIGLRE